jgi:cephalosporin-C deacetylase-like acetyl esterase
MLDEPDRSVKEPPAMIPVSRREFLAASLSLAPTAAAAASQPTFARGVDVHQELLDLASVWQARRQARFDVVRTKDAIASLQITLREAFLRLLDGLPAPAGVPTIVPTATIDADDYEIDKLAYESLPGYFVPALLYRPKKLTSRAPGILSPCGHSTNGKAAREYQILHINLVKRGYVVLTYDPVGQGERSQFWDVARGRSRFNLSCGEHAVLGNPLYLLGTSLARYRIWDGIRGLDYLAWRPEVDPTRLGCVGNSGGGTLTAYIAALDPRVKAAAICCSITTLARRMANRIQEDPSADPEQDIYGFLSAGIDHAGLLALRVPRPTLIGSAQLDFFPIDGARESFEEARRLYEVAGAPDRIAMVEAAEHHGLSATLRTAVYSWFDRWLAGRVNAGPAFELPVQPLPDWDLLVCDDRQVNLSMKSRPFLPMAWEEFDKKPRAVRASLSDLLQLDPQHANPFITQINPVRRSSQTVVVCVNGNESRDWREETEWMRSVERQGHAITVVDPRGVGPTRPPSFAKAPRYADPLSGPEENIAYNAFLVGRSLLGMRVLDVLAVIARIGERAERGQIVVCGRRDAALVACLAAAVSPRIDRVACEDMLLSFRTLFSVKGFPINAASILPGLLQRFGDIPDVIAEIAPRKVLIASALGERPRTPPHVQLIPERFSRQPERLLQWLGDSTPPAVPSPPERHSPPSPT